MLFHIKCKSVARRLREPRPTELANDASTNAEFLQRYSLNLPYTAFLFLVFIFQYILFCYFYLTTAMYCIWGQRPSPSVARWGMVLDDYDDQMVSGDKYVLNLLTFILPLRENTGKTLNQEIDSTGIWTRVLWMRGNDVRLSLIAVINISSRTELSYTPFRFYALHNILNVDLLFFFNNCTNTEIFVQLKHVLLDKFVIIQGRWVLVGFASSNHLLTFQTNNRQSSRKG